MTIAVAKKTIAIVGAGRVGQTLGRALRRRGWRIVAVVTRRASSARAAARFIGAG
ncbi:MAG: Gfo/Idh/MocA family oxidoreductase, partial [Candidatus Acidiferrales bacterium]